MANRYQHSKVLRTEQGRRYFSTTKYPRIPLSEEDIYVYTTEGDRFDLLAFQYYKDPTLWWVISVANEELTQGSLIPPIGSQIRIPGNVFNVLSSFEELNNG